MAGVRPSLENPMLYQEVNVTGTYRLLEAARFMDANECETMIAAGQEASGKPVAQILADFDAAAARFGENAGKKFGRRGEWN